MRKLTAVLLTGASLVAFTPAFAQSTAAPTAAEPAATSGLEDIIVTAQRREENIQNVSLAIQAITAAGLVRSGITDVSRLELISPGVTFGRYGTDAKISLRGANSNNTFLDSSPSVGVFIDGVYRPRAAQQTRSFFDVQRLEILKGPQGTLYGRNTLAGAVNLYTNAPDPRAFSAGVTASYERFAKARVEGFVNVPLSERFAVRLAGVIERGDGWVQNLTGGQNLGAPDTVSVRGSARYEMAGGGDVTLRVTNVRERGTQTGLFAFGAVCRNVTAQGLTDPFGTIKDCRNPRRGAGGSANFNQYGRLQVYRDFVHQDRVDEFNAVLEANVPLAEHVAAKGIFSYTAFDLDVGQDNDFSEVRVAADFLRERVKSYTSELQFSAVNIDRLKATAGAYFSVDNIDFLSASLRYARSNDAAPVRPVVTVANFTPATTLSVLNPTFVIPGPIDVGDPSILNASGAQTRGGQSSNNFQYTQTKSFGLFGQVSYELVDGFRAVGGLRYSRDLKSALNYGGARSTTTYVGPQFPVGAPLTIDGFSTNPALATSGTKRVYENVTYRAALEYDVRPGVLLYAQVSTGFLSGSLATADNNQGAVVAGVGRVGDTTDDQTSINYEAGIKSRFFDNKLQFNASVYYTKYKNLVTSFQRLNISGSVDTISANGGDIRSYGAEALIEARPIDNLRLTLGVSLLDAKFGDYSVLSPMQLYNGNPTLTGRFVNLKGGTPQFSPKFQGSFIAAYDFPIAGMGTITPQVQFFYSARYSAQTQLSFVDNAGDQPSFTKTDLQLSWNSENGRFGIDAFVQNIEDEVVNQRTTYGGDGIEQATFGYPRNYGVRLRAKF